MELSGRGPGRPVGWWRPAAAGLLALALAAGPAGCAGEAGEEGGAPEADAGAPPGSAAGVPPGSTAAPEGERPLSGTVTGHTPTGQPVEEGFLPAGGLQLFYRAVGGGEPVIVVPGGPGLDHAYLRPSIDALADRGWRVVYYDPRGVGRSGGQVDTLFISFDTYLEDLDAVRRSLDVERVRVLAHSWGGLLAMAYAMERPERVERLVLVGTVEPGLRYQDSTRAAQRSRRTEADSAALAALFASPGFQRREREVMNRIYRLSFRSTFHDPAMADSLTIDLDAVTARDGPTVAAMVMAPLGEYDFWPRLSEIRAPVLAVHGQADPIPAEMVRALVDSVPHGRAVILERAGHFPHMERPAAFLEAVDGFLREPRPGER